MEFFRNPEIKKSMLLHMLATAVFPAAAFLFCYREGVSPLGAGHRLNITMALLVLFLCLFFTLLHLSFSYGRYRQIRKLSQDIDNVLHGKDSLQFSDYAEGELSILKIEINKVLLRMREQSEALRKDKISLADSMADISHQIRTPLTSIRLILSFLSEPKLSEDRRLELVRQLSMLISRIDWLIEALLKLSRLDAGTVEFKTQSLPVKKLIRTALEPLEIPMELREQHFIFTEQTHQETFLGDLSWTVEAIGNILKNCMEHTPPGGEIRVSTTQNAIFTKLVIEDNGSGFDTADIPHLFERFYKGKNSDTQSIGIGLALARMILTRQNATIRAENTHDNGARFIIHFYQNSSGDRIVT